MLSITQLLHLYTYCDMGVTQREKLINFLQHSTYKHLPPGGNVDSALLLKTTLTH